MDKLIPHYHYILSAILTVGCVLHPASAAAALLIVFSAQLAHRFLTPNISDAERAELTEFKMELAKLKTKVEQESLGKAFRG